MATEERFSWQHDLHRDVTTMKISVVYAYASVLVINSHLLSITYCMVVWHISSNQNYVLIFEVKNRA